MRFAHAVAGEAAHPARRAFPVVGRRHGHVLVAFGRRPYRRAGRDRQRDQAFLARVALPHLEAVDQARHVVAGIEIVGAGDVPAHVPHDQLDDVRLRHAAMQQLGDRLRHRPAIVAEQPFPQQPQPGRAPVVRFGLDADPHRTVADLRLEHRTSSHWEWKQPPPARSKLRPCQSQVTVPLRTNPRTNGNPMCGHWLSRAW